MPRKPHKYHIIYKTTCKITSKYYIGMHSTSDLNDNYVGSGKRLWLSLRKYGRESHFFEILEYHIDRNSLKEREHEIVNRELLKDPLCMNLTTGGSGEYPYSTYDKQLWLWENDPVWRANKSKKLSIASSKKRKPRPDIVANGKFTMKGKHHSDESKRKISDSSKDRKYSEEFGNKISNTLKELYKNGTIKNKQLGTCWIHNEVCNKKIKKEELEKYLNEGWISGSKRSFFNEDKTTFKKNWINKDGIVKKISDIEIEDHINNGWKRGIK